MVEINNQAAAATETFIVKIPNELEVELEFGKLFKEIAEWVVEATDPTVTTATVALVVNVVKQIHADVIQHNQIVSTADTANKNLFFQAPLLRPIVVKFDASVEPVAAAKFDQCGPQGSVPYGAYTAMRFEYTNITPIVGNSFQLTGNLINGFVISVVISAVTTDDQALAPYHLLQSISISELFEIALTFINQNPEDKVMGQLSGTGGRYASGIPRAARSSF